MIDDEDRVVGTITGDLGERLLDCIENDYSYRAEIIEIDGRKCEVRIINKCYITSTATIASPNPDALSKVSEGDVLAVKVRDDSLCVVDDQDKVVGSIAKPWTKILIECVESGVEYEAGVTDIDGGACEVEVYNKSSEE
ncbi:hypothetical protein BV210_18450 (plasmid) [Halorientalis sp. IM1011]|nr:hypothetical protein BV210_18450 [Halorientalis sp. IM1011]